MRFACTPPIGLTVKSTGVDCEGMADFTNCLAPVPTAHRTDRFASAMRRPYRDAMSVAPDPRANQKQRTRTAIVEAAIALLRAGAPPTVPEAAAAAKVSRATAYRYFPTQEALLVEAAAHGPVDSIERAVAEDDSPDPRARLRRLEAAFNDVVAAEEPAMRLALRAYLDAWFAGRERGDAAPEVREGRRLRWLATALEPAKLPARDARRLQAALALTMGIEARLVMKDVCRLDDREARAVLRWTQAAILDAALPGPNG